MSATFQDGPGRLPLQGLSIDERIDATDGDARECTPDAARLRRTEEIRDLVRAFEATTLPYAQWTHAAHLAVALWYLVWHGPDGASDAMRSGLIRYNAAHEPMRVGYHETITPFWLMTLRRYLLSTPWDGSLADLTNGLIAAHTDRELPFRYYARDRLMSEGAPRVWIEPDHAW